MELDKYGDFRFTGRHHRIMYYQGRRHVLFLGRTMRSMRVFPWMDSLWYHREIFDNLWTGK